MDVLDKRDYTFPNVVLSSFMLFKSYIDSADRVIKFLILDTTEEGDK